MSQADPAARRAILCVLAHPDDEVFGSGGALARYAAEGARVVLACATRGEAGEISDPAFATPETLGDVREGELRCSAAALGISEIVLLGYRDSGMAGTPENDDPRAFVNASADEVVRRVVGLIRAERPDVVMTFDPTGVYGHPDHIAVHHHALAALSAAADPAYAPDLGEPWQAPRLVYIGIPRSAFREMRDALAAIGEDTTIFDEFEAARMGCDDADIHVRVDVSAYVDAKEAAFACHRTQFGGESPFDKVPPDVARRLSSTEHFIIGWPAPAPGAPLLTSLFDGI